MIHRSVLPFLAKKNRGADYSKKRACSVCGIHEGHAGNGSCQQILTEGGFWQQL